MANPVETPDPVISTRWGEVDLKHPDPDTISITDIAQSLSRIPRYTGHTALPVSVIDHLLLCSSLAHGDGITDPLTHLAVLLHDAHEAYTGDMATPYKRLVNEASNGLITRLEAALDTAIWAALGIDIAFYTPERRSIVKQIDARALSLEVGERWPLILDQGRWEGLVKTTMADRDRAYVLFRVLYGATGTPAAHAAAYTAEISLHLARIGSVAQPQQEYAS